MALPLRNSRLRFLPLLRGPRPTSALAGRTFSSGSNKVAFRSPAGLGFRNGETSGEGISAFITGTTPTTTPYNGDTNGTDSGLCEESEDDFDYENANRDTEMAQDIRVTFLGTSSGGGPTKTRNCSSLVVDMLGDGSLWSACCPSN